MGLGLGLGLELGLGLGLGPGSGLELEVSQRALEQLGGQVRQLVHEAVAAPGAEGERLQVGRLDGERLGRRLAVQPDAAPGVRVRVRLRLAVSALALRLAVAVA